MLSLTDPPGPIPTRMRLARLGMLGSEGSPDGEENRPDDMVASKGSAVAAIGARSSYTRVGLWPNCARWAEIPAPAAIISESMHSLR